MFKAIGLICSAWIVNGEPKQACYTHKFRWEFETKRECQIRFYTTELEKNQSGKILF